MLVVTDFKDQKLIDDIVTVMTELTKKQNQVEQICGIGSSEIQEGLEKILGVPCPGSGDFQDRFRRATSMMVKERMLSVGRRKPEFHFVLNQHDVEVFLRQNIARFPRREFDFKRQPRFVN